MASPEKKLQIIKDFDLDFQKNFDKKNAEAKKRLQGAIAAVERSVISLVSKTFGPDASEGKRAQIRQAMDMRNQLLKIFRGYYQEAAAIVSGYVPSARAAIEIIDGLDVPVEFSKVDKEIVKSLQQVSYEEFENLGKSFQKKIGDEIYQSVLTDKPLSKMIDSIANELTGIEDKMGRPMTMYADQIAHDERMKFFRSFTTQKAADVGLTKFMYVGDVIDDTRDFCAERAGNIYTLEEIQSWEDMDWAGKNPNIPVMVSLGGYRCRHHLSPVDDDTEEYLKSRE